MNPDAGAAASWLNGQLYSHARAASATDIAWQCRTTWGNGRGPFYWGDSAIHEVVAAAFELPTWRNLPENDALIIAVPLHRFPDVAALILRLDEEEPDSWPWLYAQGHEARIARAAEYSGLAIESITDNSALRLALKIDDAPKPRF